MLTNRRFFGTWELVSFESRAVDGTVTYPMGQDAVGMFICDAAGHVSAQLGRRDGDGRGYVAYFGMAEADDGERGTLTTKVFGGVNERFRVDQVRRFEFPGDDELILRPLSEPGRPTMTLVWRRLPGSV